MTTITEIQDLAADLHDLRPDDWDLVPTMNHLLPHRDLPYDELRALATAWAKDVKHRTPASLQWMRGQPVKQAESDFATQRKSKEPRCYICGDIRTDCAQARDWEIANKIPDPHEFETKEQALANRSDRQWPDLVEDLNRLRTARAKERADHARAEIRPMIATNGERPRLGHPDDQPRKCSGCGGTLSRDEHETHPGCGAQEQPAPEPDQRRVQEPWPEETPTT